MERHIDELAARQHGVVTRAQLLALGLSAQSVARRRHAGRLRPLHAGVYRIGPVTSPLAREMSAVLACGPGSLLSHGSAATLWEVRPRPKDARPEGAARPVYVRVDGNRRVRRPGIRVHSSSESKADEHTEHRGIPVTTPARTLLDLASVVGTRELENAVARAEREGLVTLDVLREMLERHRGAAGTRALNALVTALDGPQLTRSALEAELRELVRRAGLPLPRTNVRIGPWELDAFWPDARLAVEVDGFEHHSRRPRFEGDRRKDRWLATRGVQVLRFTARQIRNEPVVTAVQIGQTLALAGVALAIPR